MPENQENILVTGAAGYLASWIVNYLLRAGHTVHATVRNLKDREKVKHLEKMVKAFPNNLMLYEADLLKPDSFDEAMKSCSVVIHTASPYFLEKPKDIQKELIEPALKGTSNVLTSVNKTASVKRVVLTSSVVTLYNNASDVDHTVQEDDNNLNPDITHNPYAYSKSLAESLAKSEQEKQTRWELITLHPSAIFGPSLSQRVDATSIGIICKLLDGTFQKGVPRLWLGVVDVRNVAEAHVKAATLVGVSGRYIISAKSFRLLEVSQLINVEKHSIENKLPKNEAPKWLIWLVAPWIGLQRSYVLHNVGYPVYFDNTKSKTELNLEYINPIDTFNDHIQQLIDDKLIGRA